MSDLGHSERRWRSEPCGRCGHDVNAHFVVDDDDIAGDCDVCDCHGFITMTAKTIEKYGAWPR